MNQNVTMLANHEFNLSDFALFLLRKKISLLKKLSRK